MLWAMLSTATARALDAWLAHEIATEIIRDTVVALGQGVRVMPLKGALLARTYYCHASERWMRDCDVLVAGVTMRQAIARLGAHGYEPFEWSNTARILTLRPPGNGMLLLDVHFRPLPCGLGCVDTAWMMNDATTDETLFGVPVRLPAPPRLLVQLLGNVLKDHVHRASSHCASDVAHVLQQSGIDLDECASAIRSARLRLGSSMALEWVFAQTGSQRAKTLQDLLELTRAERRQMALRLSLLRRSSREPTLLQRLVARTSGDTQSDRIRAVCAAGLGACTSAIRNRRIRHALLASSARKAARGRHGEHAS
jgi:hypothetical protein